MPEFATTITFQVVYRAKEAESATGERAHALAETMLAVLRGSPKVKAVDVQCEAVGEIEPLDDGQGPIPLRIEP